MPLTLDGRDATGVAAGPRPDLSARRRSRHLWSLFGATVALLAAACVALAAAGLLAWAPLVLLVAVPVALRVAATVVQLFLVTLVRPIAAPPRVAGATLSSAMANTAVVYPAIVVNAADVTALTDTIRDNRDATGRGPALHLALVDFADSPHKDDGTDERLRRAVTDGIAGLGDGAAPVAVLFRRRVWNPAQGVFMGWERKRGKVEELAALIGGRDDTTFVTLDAEQDLVRQLRLLRYLLVIDVGDRLEPRAARRLVATIAHPDNAAVVSPRRRLVVSGFGFVRPLSVQAPPQTLFEWASFPYEQPQGVPSPLQSAFGHDIFLGKGVIDIAAYRAVLVGSIPDNRVLSHDRLEGLYCRTASVTDARIVEGNVSDYLHNRARQHRWIRGDTHLLPWMLGRTGLARLSTMDRIELARDWMAHLYPMALTALLAAAWIAAPVGQVGWWTAALLIVSAHPIVATTLLPQLVALRFAANGPARRNPRMLAAIWRRTLPVSLRLFGAETARWLLSMAIQLDMTLSHLDAMTRAGYRMTISHRNVLQWTSSTQQGRLRPGLGLRVRRLWPASLVAAALAVAAGITDPVRLWWAAPLLLLWFATPLVAHLSNRPSGGLPSVSMM